MLHFLNFINIYTIYNKCIESMSTQCKLANIITVSIYILCYNSTGNGWTPMQSAFIAPQEGVYFFSYSTVTAVISDTEIKLRLSTSETQTYYPCFLWNYEIGSDTNGMDFRFCTE